MHCSSKLPTKTFLDYQTYESPCTQSKHPVLFWRPLLENVEYCGSENLSSDVLGVFKKFHLHLEVYDSTDTNAGFGIVSILGLWILAHWIVLKKKNM